MMFGLAGDGLQNATVLECMAVRAEVNATGAPSRNDQRPAAVTKSLSLYRNGSWNRISQSLLRVDLSYRP
jgi:hypothetical protein